MDSNITDILKDILEDESLLDPVPKETLEELYSYLGFYLRDRDEKENELSFDEGSIYE